jgi:hypothetical protein
MLLSARSFIPRSMLRGCFIIFSALRLAASFARRVVAFSSLDSFACPSAGCASASVVRSLSVFRCSLLFDRRSD